MPPSESIEGLNIAPADITGVVKNYMGDVEGRHKAIREFVADRRADGR